MGELSVFFLFLLYRTNWNIIGKKIDEENLYNWIIHVMIELYKKAKDQAKKGENVH